MKLAATLGIPASYCGVLILWITGSSGIFIPNLTDACFECLCNVVTNCDRTNQCGGGYCGPFNISRVYWADSGRITLDNDDPERKNAWSDCANDYNCATRIIAGYISRYGRDCNNDGVTNCYDYMLINGNGGPGCHVPLNRTENGRRWLKRYADCTNV